ncbi:MAG: hypothetical protein JSR90_20645 [Proteobacteria bacterium]|nr:hypothetical protein [Pseudomonadota bacterium]
MKSKLGRLAAVTLAAAALVAGTAPIVSAQMPWVLIARKAAQRIHHMELQAQGADQPRQDFATVILEAPADHVFATVVNLATKNPEVHVITTDPAARRMVLTQGDRLATLSVAELSPEVSQLMIAGSAGPNEDPTASRVVGAVMRVCAEMKKECSLSN